MGWDGSWHGTPPLRFLNQVLKGECSEDAGERDSLVLTLNGEILKDKVLTLVILLCLGCSAVKSV